MEKTILKMDTSSMVQAMKCDAFYNFVTVQSLTRKHVDRTAMDRGTVMHGLLQRYYYAMWQGENWAMAMNYAHDRLNNLNKVEEEMQVRITPDDFKLVLLRFNDYCIKWCDDKFQIETIDHPEKGKIPGIEVGFSVPVLDTPEKLYVLEGRIDLMARMSDQLVIWDHKAQARKYFLYGFSLQALNYMLATGANRFMYNYVRLHQKVQPDTFDRKLSFASRTILSRWKTKLIATFDKVAREQKEGNLVERHYPNQSCADIGFGKVCPFTTVCEELNPSVREQLLKLNYVERTKWEPWSIEEEIGEAA